MRFIKIYQILFLCFAFNLLNSNIAIPASLLDQVKGADAVNPTEAIFEELLKPIILYDPKVMKIQVLKDMEIFKGQDEVYPEIWRNSFADDKDIYDRLSPKDGELLLRFNVQVNISPEHIQKIHETLSSYSKVTEKISETEPKTRLDQPNAFPVGFYVGSIKGNPRVQLFKDAEYFTMEPFHRMSLRNQDVNNRNGMWLHKPFVFYGFDASMLPSCDRWMEKIQQTGQISRISNFNDKSVNFGAAGAFAFVFPYIYVDFLSENGEVQFSDQLGYIGFGQTASRTLSLDGYLSAQTNGLSKDVYQSVVIVDPKNGWHPQDAYTTHESGLWQTWTAAWTRNFYTEMQLGLMCNFTFSEQTNFSIVTKVTKELLGKTENINVKMKYCSNKERYREPFDCN
jgi:hypothetical protein